MAYPGELVEVQWGTLAVVGKASVEGLGKTRARVKKGGMEDLVQLYRPANKVDTTPLKVEIEDLASVSGGLWTDLASADVKTLTLTVNDEAGATAVTYTCSAFISSIEPSGMEEESNATLSVEFSPTTDITVGGGFLMLSKEKLLEAQQQEPVKVEILGDFVFIQPITLKELMPSLKQSNELDLNQANPDGFA